jgi:FtsZ-interacting cell division protein YlmF
MAEPPSRVFQVTRFNDVQLFGEAFNAGERVEFSVEGAGRDLACRAVDFATGMVYANRGSMRRVGPDRYVMEPRSGGDRVRRGSEQKTGVRTRTIRGSGTSVA